MDNFTFSPSTGFNDTSVYTDPASGTQARQQLMSLHTQTQTFINDQLVATINSMQETITTLTQRIAALEAQLSGYETLFTTSGLQLVVGGTTYAISVEEGAVTATEVS